MSEPLRVLVADDIPDRARALAAGLADAGYRVVGIVEDGGYLPSHVADAKPDVVLVHTDSPSRDTLEQLGVLRRDLPRPVVMFSSDEGREAIRSAIEAGVSAYITSGLTQSRVEPIIDVAIETFNAHQQVRSELERTRATLEERKTIDRAKGILMERRGIAEPEAFRLLRSAAMDQKKRLGEIAADIVHAAALLDRDRETKPQR